MRLNEIFSELKEKSILDIEKDLDKTLYQPEPKVIKGKEPVIDLDLTSSPHFKSRLIQRGEKANITPEEIEQLFRDGRETNKVNIGKASRIDDFSSNGEHIDFYDEETKLLVPTIVKPNEKCKPNSRGKVTCDTVNGPEPKNKLIAKTIMRKGIED